MDGFISPLELDDIKLVGRGSQAKVYRARYRRGGVEPPRDVACKVFHGFDVDMQELEREVRALATLRHRHLVSVLGVSEIEGSASCILEWIGGGTLADWLWRSGNSPSLPTAISIVIQIADALAYLHEGCGRQTLHGDVKLQNVLLVNADDVSHVKLADLGLARILGPDMTHVTTGSPQGTPSYMAPEAFGDLDGTVKIAPAADVYSLGIVMWELITGERAWATTSPWLLAGFVRQGARPPLDSRLPSELSGLMKRAWAADPSTRPSAMDIASELRVFSRSPKVNADPNVDRSCVICLVKKRSVLLPCGHFVLCENCFERLCSQETAGECPLCRMPISSEGVTHLSGGGMSTFVSGGKAEERIVDKLGLTESDRWTLLVGNRWEDGRWTLFVTDPSHSVLRVKMAVGEPYHALALSTTEPYELHGNGNTPALAKIEVQIEKKRVVRTVSVGNGAPKPVIGGCVLVEHRLCFDRPSSTRLVVLFGE